MSAAEEVVISATEIADSLLTASLRLRLTLAIESHVLLRSQEALSNQE
jgi:hypothetical protein